ncbi:MAG TPA: type III-A CRISPR-associated protein Cas10/Csm1 [Roseiarcus sp.]|nr:type III-A CRISPR-associated protein Cas10/Csm1 [Roseiarcus sp.]
MAPQKAERAAEFALAALLRGLAEFAHRAISTGTPAQALERLAGNEFGRVLSKVTGSSAVEIALRSLGSPQSDKSLLGVAWRAASGIEPGRAVRITQMRSPLAAVFQFKDSNAVLPLKRLALDESVIPATPATSDGALRDLFKEFAVAISQLESADVPTLLQSLLAALESFTWCVPASGYDHVSIFDVARTAAAIAAVLAAHYPAEDAAPADYEQAKLVLAVGDLSGIQRFLYTVVASKAARMLRGRSLGLQLIADAIAQRILSSLELPAVNLLYSGGGKLWLLAPESEQEALLRLGEEIDLELNTAFAARLSFGIGCASITLSELSSGAPALWENATRDLAFRRSSRFSRLLKTRYEEIFEPFGDLEHACRVCGVSTQDLKPLSRDGDDYERDACPQCRDFVELGRYAPRAQVIVRQPSDVAVAGAPMFRYSPPASTVSYVLYEKAPESAPVGSTVMWVNGPPRQWKGPAAHGIWLAGLGRATKADEVPPDFDELAENSEGIKRLGVLRMDVDSLGNTLRNGFGAQASLPRIAALSRHLGYFFGGYLAHLLDEPGYRAKLQIIYSGGDDLFIVGAWSETPLIARTIRREFARFTAGNPHWGLSAGIALTQPRFPIVAGAELAGKAEEFAKDYSRRTGGHKGQTKDAISFLNEVFGWKDNEDFDVLCKLRDSLRELFPGDGARGLPRATLRTLYALASEARAAGDVIDSATGAATGMGDLASAVKRGKWSWLAAYAIARAPAHGPAREKLEELYHHLERFDWRNSTSSRPVLWLLRPATEWVDLLNREKRP